MKICEKYQKNLLLYVYDELDEVDRAQLEAHLQVCPDCRQETSQLEKFIEAVPARSPVDPDESTLKVLRNALSLKIREKGLSTANRGWTPFSFIMPSPALQAAFVILLVAFGFLLGRRSWAPQKPDEMLFQHLITASRQIQASNSAIDPYMATIDKVDFDEKSGTVQIRYNTINDISYRGRVDNPVVGEILRYAVAEENSPAIRLHAVKTINAIAQQHRNLDPQLIEAIDFLLQKEQNPGVRLMALRVLKNLPMNETIKNALVRILLFDQNTGVRIQAFETLTGSSIPHDEMQKYLYAAKQDSNSYISNKADEMLQRIQQNTKPMTLELSREE